MYFILFIAIAVASYAVQASLKSKFSTYSKTPLSNGMTGAQVAEKMLRDNGINNVKVTQIEGQLTDHYNPATLTVNLSRNVYYGSSVAAAWQRRPLPPTNAATPCSTPRNILFFNCGPTSCLRLVLHQT